MKCSEIHFSHLWHHSLPINRQSHSVVKVKDLEVDVKAIMPKKKTTNKEMDIETFTCECKNSLIVVVISCIK